MKTITLTAAHEHDGCEHPAGTELVLTETDADWLIGVGKAKAAVTNSKVILLILVSWASLQKGTPG